MKKFEIIKGNDVDDANEWFEKCKKEMIPYVIINKKRKYAQVYFDHISISPEFDQYFRDVYEANNNYYYAEEIVDLYNKYSNKKSSARLGNLYTSFYNIEISKAEELAVKLYDLNARRIKQFLDYKASLETQ